MGDSFEEFIEEFVMQTAGRGWRFESRVQRQIGRFFFHLQQKNQQFNLTGYKTLAEYLDFHLADALQIAQWIQPRNPSSIVDVGSGCGVPGILLKILHPEWRVVLIESNRKKARFLSEISEYLELADCAVLNERAEEAARKAEWRETLDSATARALGPLPVTLELTAGFVRVGGTIVLPRGGDENVVKESSRVADALGCHLKQVILYALPRLTKPFQAAIYEKVAALSDKFPRKPGQIRKHPL